MLELLWKVIEWIAPAIADRRRVRFTVHRAYFTGEREKIWAYFLDVTNLSKTREIEITHVWLDTRPPVHAMPPERPLPKRLMPDESWQTWIEEEKLPAAARRAPFRLGRVRLSTGAVVGSVENKNVPARGWVPGGPVASYRDE